jgi:hypothetical protein
MDRIRVYEYEIVHEFPHDPTAFTQVWFLVFSTHQGVQMLAVSRLSLSRTLSLSQACRIFSSSHERERSISVCVCVCVYVWEEKEPFCLLRQTQRTRKKQSGTLTLRDSKICRVWSTMETRLSMNQQASIGRWQAPQDLSAAIL